MRRFTAFVLGLCLSLPVLAEQVQRFGDLDVHYNVFNSSFLQPNVASAVGLVRSKAQGVINVVPMEKGKPVEAAVTGSAKDLTGKVIPWSSAESARKAPSTTWRNSRSASARPWSSPSRSRPRANLRRPSVSTRKSSRTNDQARTAGAGQPQCRQTQGTPGHARRQREGALDRRVQPGGTGGNRSFLRRERHPQGTQRRTPLRPAGAGRRLRAGGGLPRRRAGHLLGALCRRPGRRGEQRQAAGGHEGCPGRRARRTVRQRAGAGAPRRRPLPISARASGKAASSAKPAAPTASATTRCSGCRNATAPAPSWRPRRRTASATEPAPWPCSSSAWVSEPQPPARPRAASARRRPAALEVGRTHATIAPRNRLHPAPP